jgi:hypothetical protein
MSDFFQVCDVYDVFDVCDSSIDRKPRKNRILLARFWNGQFD